MDLATKFFQKNLSEIMSCECFALLKVASIYAYENNERQNAILGTRYTVANPDTYEVFDVKVPTTVPVVSQEQIDASDERFWVAFENATLKPYKIQYGNAVCTVTADAVKLVKND